MSGCGSGSGWLAVCGTDSSIGSGEAYSHDGRAPEVARGLARLGATVYDPSRTRDRGEATRDELRRDAGHERVDFLEADLALLESVRAFAAAFRERADRLDVLVNNAGVTRDSTFENSGYYCFSAADGETLLPSSVTVSRTLLDNCNSYGLAATGLGLAWYEFGRQGAPRIGFVERYPALRRFLAERWYLDHLYGFLLRQVVDRVLAGLCAGGDRRVIDPGIDAFSRGTAQTGDLLARLHAGMVQHRLLAIFAVVTLLAAFVLI